MSCMASLHHKNLLEQLLFHLILPAWLLVVQFIRSLMFNGILRLQNYFLIQILVLLTIFHPQVLFLVAVTLKVLQFYFLKLIKNFLLASPLIKHHILVWTLLAILFLLWHKEILFNLLTKSPIMNYKMKLLHKMT